MKSRPAYHSRSALLPGSGRGEGSVQEDSENSRKSYMDYCKDEYRNRKNDMHLLPQGMSDLPFRQSEYRKQQEQHPCEFSCYHGSDISISCVPGQDAVG